MIEIKQDVTPREIRVFGLLWLGFFAALGGMALWRPESLLGAATILGAAWLASLILNAENRPRQLLGLGLPAAFALIGTAARDGESAWTAAAVVWAAGLAGALTIWAVPAAGRTLYFGWMYAALPLGWTISRVVLALVYYVVITPIGVAMRLLGHDAMRRRFEREARTYWIERRTDDDPRRAFRQF